jgi:thiamine biosynthesis protein ThiS
VFETGSKAGLPVLGLTGLSAIVNAAPCPVLAIGGITPSSVHAVLTTGANGIAVMSGICASDDPERKAREYRDALNGVDMSKQSETGSGAIAIQVNGKAAELRSEMTIAEFLEQKGLHQNMVVVEHNGKILKKGQFGESEIRAGDVLEVVHFVGGG